MEETKQTRMMTPAPKWETLQRGDDKWLGELYDEVAGRVGSISLEFVLELARDRRQNNQNRAMIVISAVLALVTVANVAVLIVQMVLGR